MKISRSLLLSGLFILPGVAQWSSTVAEGSETGLISLESEGSPGFEEMNLEGSITLFENEIPTHLYRTNQILLNGSGVSIGDVNGDGRPDIFATSVGASNTLLINQGDWKFNAATDQDGIILPSAYSTGSVLVDLDGDHDLDLLVSTIKRGTFLFRNDEGRFADVTHQSGVNSGVGGMSITVGDYDLDGFLDFYVCNYRESALMDVPNARMNLGTRNGKQVITDFNGRSVSEPDLQNRFYVDERGGIGEYGELDRLYRNRGNWTFEPISFTDGAFLDESGQALTENPYDWGLAAAFRDINQDGLPDLYVCNDFDTPDRIWINQGRGQFKALPTAAMRQSSWFSMGVDFADINQDGRDDFITLDMLGSNHQSRMTQLGDIAPAQHLIKNPEARPQFLKTCLFLNRGQGQYSELGQYAGVAATDWAWCPIFIDVDLDGREDLLVSNGNERDGRNLDVADELKKLRARENMSDDRIFTERMRFPRLPSANLAFRNVGGGRFQPAPEEWGFGHVGVSHGMALGDLDGDGDQDLVVNHLNEPLGFFRNNSSAPRIAVRLRGNGPNTKGIGARITFRIGEQSWAQEIMAGGRYLSSDDPMRVFAVPSSAAGAKSLQVQWPSGAVSTLDSVEANRIYEIEEPEPSGKGQSTAGASSRESEVAWFSDQSEKVDYVHQRDEFDDFFRQPLLLRRCSDLDPGVSWYDIDDDGFDDLIIGTGRGGRLGIFRNDEGRAFFGYSRAPFDRPISRDTTSVLGAELKPGDPSLVLGFSNYEDGLDRGGTVGNYRFRSKTPAVIKPGELSSVGPLALADWDGDGDLDLFVGGRFLPGKIPAAPRSALFLNEGGQFKRVPDDESGAVGTIGMVSAAVFTDLDGDRDPDLTLALEWGSVEVLINVEGRFARATEQWDLDQYRGWWNGIQAGDFNNDGRMDLVVSNWGQNSPYERYSARDFRVQYGDMDGNGQGDLIASAYDSQLDREVPIRQLGSLARGLPKLKQIFSSNRAFSEASTESILSEFTGNTETASVNWLQSTVFLNQGERFDAIPLPAEAQWSPAFGVSVADFDGDGYEDLFLAQNFFGVRSDVSRYDAGQGLVMKGLGNGRFQSVSHTASGINILGEQRGAAVADFDHDGRVDLAVGQNGQAVKLYRNQHAKPGLRVKLIGPPGNPTAVGASLWLSDGRERGPMKEIRAGGGYYSQDAPMQVLTFPGVATQLNVLWPNGKQDAYPLKDTDRAVTVGQDGIVSRNSN